MNRTATEPKAIIVMGVAGSGKSTVGELLAQRLGAVYADGDSFHSPANVAKMSAGIPLSDDDRWPWLATIRDWLSAQHGAGQTVVVACSALKRRYRDVLRAAGEQVVFIHLTGEPELLATRISGRTDHYMPPALLASQLADLEPLANDEPGFAVDVERTPDDVVETTLENLRSRVTCASPSARV